MKTTSFTFTAADTNKLLSV